MVEKTANRAKTAAALTKLFEAAKTLQSGTKDPFLAHQVIKQALASAGISKIVDATDELQKKYLASQERKEVVTEAIGIDNFLVPSYRYTPADKVSAKLNNSDSKTNGEDFLMVLRAIVEDYVKTRYAEGGAKRRETATIPLKQI